MARGSSLPPPFEQDPFVWLDLILSVIHQLMSFSCFQYLVIINNTVLNILVCVCVDGYISSSPGVELLSHMVVLCLTS